MSAENLALFLRERVKEIDQTQTHLLRKANISRLTWYRLINADIQKAKLSTLLSFTRILDVSLIEILNIYFRISKTNKKLVLGCKEASKCQVIEEYPPNYTIVKPNEVFTKNWHIHLSNTPDLQQIMLECLDKYLEVKFIGDSENLNIGNLMPTAEKYYYQEMEPTEKKLSLSINFKAPSLPCTCISHWRFKHPVACLEELPELSCIIKTQHFS